MDNNDDESNKEIKAGIIFQYLKLTKLITYSHICSPKKLMGLKFHHFQILYASLNLNTKDQSAVI